MTNTERAYRQLVSLGCALLCLLAPTYVWASLSHRATLPFPDRAQHATQQDLTVNSSDHHLTSNLPHTRRVGARDVGKAAAECRWVGASPHLGMPKELIDGEGRLAWAASHSAYGAVIETQGPADVEVDGGFVQSDGPRVESPFRLLGQVNDEDAELAWTRFRCFDAETGTWISTDPLGLLGGTQTYGFDGSPSAVVDPLGLSTQGGQHSESYAEIHHYPGDASNPYGHYSVRVTTADKSLHTHQVITSHDYSTTTITTDPTRAPDKVVRVPLANGQEAQTYQESQLGKQLGPYDQRKNSCVDHVAETLRAGGVEVPKGGLGQYKYLKGLGF